VPGRRNALFWQQAKASIEIANYLKTHDSDPQKNKVYISDTLGHEMIHYWLWLEKKPYGHTPEFHKKMKEMGVSRYNQNPKSVEYRYRYFCLTCETTYPGRKMMAKAACRKCCVQYSGGAYDTRYILEIVKITPMREPKGAKEKT
jgi:predicted SprT family Zn-dependent metalloprotease